MPSACLACATKGSPILAPHCIHESLLDMTGTPTRPCEKMLNLLIDGTGLLHHLQTGL